MKLTAAQLAKFRRSAHLYCKLMELDPNELIGQQGTSQKAPRWEVVAVKIREEWAMRVAVNNQPL